MLYNYMVDMYKGAIKLHGDRIVTFNTPEEQRMLAYLAAMGDTTISLCTIGTGVTVEDQSQPLSELNDTALVIRVARGDVAAFSLLYDRYARPVYTLAVHTLGSADAEEMVQEIFLRLWNRAGQFDSQKGAFSTWFMAIARHRILDELRRRGQQQRLVAVEHIDQLLFEPADPSVDLEASAWANQRGDALLAALKTLPEEQRRALVLAYFGGLSQSSISEQLGWPLGTVKKRTRLGLQKLRIFLVERGLTAETEDEPAPKDTK